MTALAQTSGSEPAVDSAPAAAQAVPAAAMTPSELAELLGAFNEVTSKLNSAHEALRAEVVRLQGELRAASEQLERSRRLAALGEMAAGIAHEVRNPLGSIRLYAKMLADDLHDRPGERLLAEKIAGATRGLDAVVSDVLAFSRETRVSLEGVEVGDVIGRALDECLAAEREVGGARVRVVREDAESGADSREVVCDAGLLHRALVNVVRNALEANRESGRGGGAGELRLRVLERVKPGADGAARRFLAIAVHDSGPGIPPEVMGRIFNPFFTTRATGTGLGLAIVHRIIDAHGGRVEVWNQTTPGGGVCGAVVELLLPLDNDTPRAKDGRGAGEHG